MNPDNFIENFDDNYSILKNRVQKSLKKGKVETFDIFNSRVEKAFNNKSYIANYYRIPNHVPEDKKTGRPARHNFSLDPGDDDRTEFFKKGLFRATNFLDTMSNLKASRLVPGVAKTAGRFVGKSIVGDLSFGLGLAEKIIGTHVDEHGETVLNPIFTVDYKQVKPKRSIFASARDSIRQKRDGSYTYKNAFGDTVSMEKKVLGRRFLSNELKVERTKKVSDGSGNFTIDKTNSIDDPVASTTVVKGYSKTVTSYDGSSYQDLMDTSGNITRTVTVPHPYGPQQQITVPTNTVPLNSHNIPIGARAQKRINVNKRVQRVLIGAAIAQSLGRTVKNVMTYRDPRIPIFDDSGSSHYEMAENPYMNNYSLGGSSQRLLDTYYKYR